MPARGCEGRAEQLATLDRLAHQRLASDELARLLEELRPYEDSLPPDSDEASLVRVARRDHEKARPVPAELRGELARAGSLGYAAWLEARRRSDYSLFLPHLRRHIELRLRYVECFEVNEPYDALLDDYEPGLTATEVAAVFERLTRELRPFLELAAERGEPVDDSFLRRPYPVEKQRELELAVLERLGFDAEAWRLDPSPHPFMVSPARLDIRLTTRYEEGRLTAPFYALHEFGHGLYERSIAPSLERTPLGRGASMALHESQSRLWENLVGRSRPFWRHFFPQFQRTFPSQLAGVDAEAFYRAVNKVALSPIRVSSDEASYNLHIVLRFELERELIAGRLDPSKLPEAWNERTREYLGLEPPDDARGVLQDSHWGSGLLGYFPTYSLGNVASVQIWEAARAALRDLDEQLGQGELRPLAAWLEQNLYRHGRKFTLPETLLRVTGGPLDAEPYLRYLKAKLAEVSGLAGCPH